MNMDSLNGSNPLSDENTNSPDDISRMFNPITYSKGATFVRSVKNILGEQNFAASLKEYLRYYSYKTTVPENLFSFWSRYWPSNFQQYDTLYLKSFTEQVGYPVITIKLASDGQSFTIQQKRFLLKPGDGADSTPLYVVPVSYTTSAQKNFMTTTPTLFLPAQASQLTRSLNGRADWIIANIQQAYYYRLNYDESNWHAIHHALMSSNWDGIHDLNRAQIVNDLFNLARANEISYDLALLILEYLSTETNYAPWQAAIIGFQFLENRLGTNNELFKPYIRGLTEKSYKALGFEERSSDSSTEIYLRSIIISRNCKYGNEDCINRARQYFQRYPQTKVPVNIRSPIYCAIMREGNDADFETLYQKFLTETIATENTLLLNTLGCVKKQSLVERYFNIILGNSVRLQDKSAAMFSLYSSNMESVMPVFRLFIQNLENVARA